MPARPVPPRASEAASAGVTGLRKRFGPVVALDGLSFMVLPGQVTGFVGPNGAGKSTTMRMIAGLDESTAGRGPGQWPGLPWGLGPNG